MFGTFQHSNLRIEVAASHDRLQRCFTQPAKLQQWLKFQRFVPELPTELSPGLTFWSLSLGVIPVKHTIDRLDTNNIRFLLSQGVDGFHEWSWGEGWVQSRLEGVSLLPLNLGQSLSLWCLQQYLQQSPD
ncbi:MAG: hypothetical protein VKJ24_03860 [Synechococcales bacterium]|nr:hypothetical protein [Synechococcales bacterium]